MKAITRLDSRNRLVITREMRDVAGVKVAWNDSDLGFQCAGKDYPQKEIESD